MSTPNKLRGGGKSELTRLKALQPAERAEIYSWRSETPAPTNAAIRTRIGERFGVTLRRDGQLSEFWSWQFRQQAIDRLGEMMEQDEALLQDKFPGLSRDAIRDAAIKRGYAMADLAGDLELSLKVAKVDLKDSEERRNWEKYRDNVAERKRAIEAEIGKARTGGGLTPETLERIERELKLL